MPKRLPNGVRITKMEIDFYMRMTGCKTRKGARAGVRKMKLWNIMMGRPVDNIYY